MGKTLRKVLFFLSLLIFLPLVCSVEAKAASDKVDVSKLSLEMQCAAGVNGIEHDGVLYFTDGTLYCYDKNMAESGKAPKVYKKGVRKFFIEGNYIYYWKPWSNSLYRMEIGKSKSTLVSRGVYYVLSTDEEKIYFWGKKYLYEVNYDGSGLKKIFNNKGNMTGSSLTHETAYILDGKMFYSKAVNGNGSESWQYWNYDHKICVMDLETGEKKTLVNPKGKNSEFSFGEIEGELYAWSGQLVYKYDTVTEKFISLGKIIPTGRGKIGKDGENIYATDWWAIVYDDGTYDYDDPESLRLLFEKWADSQWAVYRIGKDWKYRKLFDIQGVKYGEEDYFKLIATDGEYFCFVIQVDDPWIVCTDSNGIIRYQCYIEREAMASDYWISSEMKIKDGVFYLLTFTDSKVDLAKIVNLSAS